jgi:hypothetical protein
MARDTCRLPQCSNPPREGTGRPNAFCSTACHLKYSHIRADAREARYDDQEAAR